MYINSVNAANLEWPTKYDDMFPYADKLDAYWTGYFTSRPILKEKIRRSSQIFYASSQLFAATVINSSLTLSDPKITERVLNATHKMMDVIGVTQHHDAVTGTSTADVAADYQRILTDGLDFLYPVYTEVIDLIANKAGFEGAHWQWCTQLNSTYLDCPIATYEYAPFNMLVAVHNPSDVPLNLT